MKIILYFLGWAGSNFEASMHEPVHTQNKEVTRQPQVTCVSLS